MRTEFFEGLLSLNTTIITNKYRKNLKTLKFKKVQKQTSNFIRYLYFAQACIKISVSLSVV